MRKIIVFISIIFCFYSCGNKEIQVERAFYYWKSGDWYLDKSSETVLDEIQAKKLYVKFFEIENNELMGNIPVSKNNMRIENKDIELIPTVFIKNGVFKKSKNGEIDLLAFNIHTLMNKYIDESYEDFVINEVQFDCDWTPSTKESYFYFLKKFKELTQRKMSCTLRLYPYKYRDKMGVPPVDKVMLMCYNLLNPLENKDKNSILDVDELGKYLTVSEKYPLHMDVALPIYSWIQIYQNNQFSGLVYNDISKVLANSREIKPMWREVNNDITIDNHYLRLGDKIKYEKIDSEIIYQAIKLLKDKIDWSNSTTLSLFHLDDNQLQYFTNEEINSFYTAFSTQ